MFCSTPFVVGYSTSTELSAGQLKAFTTSFEDVAGGEIAIATMSTAATPAAAVAFGNSADQIWRWDTETAAWVQYFNRKYSSRDKTGDEGWCKSGEKTLTTDTIGAGETFFYRRATGSAASTITFSGAVKPFAAKRSYENILAGQLVFMGYPWPVAMPIVNMTQYQGDTGAAAVAFGNSADQIWRWDTESAAWIQYFNRKYSSRDKTGDEGWCKSGEKTLTTDSVNAGEGFFFRRATGSTAGTVEFSFPESK